MQRKHKLARKHLHVSFRVSRDIKHIVPEERRERDSRGIGLAWSIAATMRYLPAALAHSLRLRCGPRYCYFIARKSPRSVHPAVREYDRIP